MRYTEYEYKIENPADAIRVLSSSIILAPFRLLNEYTKKIMFIDREVAKKHLLYAILINLVLFATEVLSVLLGRRTIVIVDTFIIPSLLSIAFLFLLYFLLNKRKVFKVDTRTTKVVEFDEIITKEEVSPKPEQPTPNEVINSATTIPEDNFSNDISALKEELSKPPQMEKFTSKTGLMSDDILKELLDDEFTSFELFRETPQEVSKALDTSVERDEFKLNGTVLSPQELSDELLKEIIEQTEYRR